MVIPWTHKLSDNDFKKRINLKRPLVRFLFRLTMNPIRTGESKSVRLIPCTAFRLSRTRFGITLIPIPDSMVFKMDSSVSNSIILRSAYPISFATSNVLVRYVHVVSLLTMSVGHPSSPILISWCNKITISSDKLCADSKRSPSNNR